MAHVPLIPLFLDQFFSATSIPEEYLNRVFDEGFSRDKSGGTGLGLAQAKKAIELNEGRIFISSKLNVGTNVKIELPVETCPTWCKTKLKFSPNRPVYFVDDDLSVLAYWRSKMQSFGNEITVAYFSTLESIPKDNLRNAILVLDQDFKDGFVTGLDWLKKLSVIPETYLCTASYDDPKIQERVKALRISMIPKPLLVEVEIEFSRSLL